MTTNTLGSDPAFRPKPATAWLLPFAPMGFAAFSLSALVFFHLRQDAFEVQSALQHAYAALYRAIGFAPAVMFFGLVILWSTIWLANGALQRPLQRLGRLAAMAALLGVLLNLGDGGVSPALHKGALGAAIAQALVSAVGYWPSLVLVWAVTFASLLLATDFFFQESFERLFAAPRESGPAHEPGVEPMASDRLREVAAEPVTAAAPTAVEVESSRRRRSYDERRAEREAMASRWSALAATAPAAEPATVDADDAPAAAPAVEAAADPFELSAARVVDAIDAAAEPESAAVESDVVEALQRDASDEGFAPALARAQRTPIVFPDEVPVADAGPVAEPAPFVDGWPPAPVASEASASATEPSAADAAAMDATDDAGFDAAADAALAEDALTEEVAPTTPTDVVTAAAAESTPADAASDGEPDDALGLGDEVIVLADPNEPGFAASYGAVAESSEAEPVEAAVEPVAAEAAPAPAAADEAEVAIPRPEPTPARAAGLDEGLVAEAIELVTSSRRANTVFLQRKLRVDYEQAAALLAELAARGVVALDAEATHGRVLR